MRRLLIREGSTKLGINAIAREAAVDKVLIYRYFGGLEGLFHAFALEGDAFPQLEELAGGSVAKLATQPPPQAAARLLIGFGRRMREDKLMLEIQRWALAEESELSRVLSQHRERQSVAWIEGLRGDAAGDLDALISLLSAGQMFLALRAKTAKQFNGIAIRSEQGWQRIEAMVELLTKLFFASAHRTSKPRGGRRGTRGPSNTRNH